MLNQFKHIISEDNENLSQGMKDFLNYQKNLKVKKTNFKKIILFVLSVFILVWFSLFFLFVKNSKAEVLVRNIPVINNQISIPSDIGAFNSLFCIYQSSVSNVMTLDNEEISPFFSSGSSYAYQINNLPLSTSHTISFSDDTYSGGNYKCFIVDNINSTPVSTTTNSTNAWVNPSVAIANGVSQGDFILDFVLSDSYPQTTNDNSIIIGSASAFATVPCGLCSYNRFSAVYKVADTENETLSLNMWNDGSGGSTHKIFVFNQFDYTPVPIEYINYFGLSYDVYKDSEFVYSSLDTNFKTYNLSIGNVSTSTEITIEITLPERYLEYEGAVFNLYLTDDEGNFIKTYQPPSNTINSTNFPSRTVYFTVPLSDFTLDSRQQNRLNFLVSQNEITKYNSYITLFLFSGEIPADIIANTFGYDTELFAKTKDVWRKKIIFSTFMSIFDGASSLNSVFQNSSQNQEFNLSLMGSDVNIFDFGTSTAEIRAFTLKFSNFIFFGLFILYIIYRATNSFGSQDI